MKIFGKQIKLKRKQKFFVFILLFILLIVAAFSYLSIVVNPVIFDISQAKVKNLTQRAINSAVYEVINQGPIYDELVIVKTNENGDPVFISTDAVQINRLSRELVDNSQKNLEQAGINGIDIPIGSFSGIPIFVGRGPNFRVKLTPIGVISCSFVSEFKSAGVNQTNHRIYVNIKSSVSVIIPTVNQTVSTITQLMIAESIIVGKIPDTYLNSSNLDEMLNLVPA